MNNDTIYEKLKELLVSNFAIDPESIGLEKRLDEDLKLDSLDAVDIIISLKNYVSDKIDPALFKNACTVQDMVDLLQPIWKT